MLDLEDLLREYFKAVEAGKFPDDSDIKKMFELLQSATSYAHLKSEYSDRCQQLDRIFLKSKCKEISCKIIENQRRNEMRKKPDWYKIMPAYLEENEKRTTELISIVEVAYFLLVNVGCDHNLLNNFFELEESKVFELAKLISAFTGDFKLLEMHLRFASKLMDNLIKYLFEVNSNPKDYSLTEKKNLESLILEYISDKKAQETVDFLIGALQKIELVGYMGKQFGSMIFVGLVCENLDQFEKRMNTKILDLARLAGDKDNKPLILHMIEDTVVQGIEGMKMKEKNVTNEAFFENSKKALALSVPILKYVIHVGLLDKFEPARLRDQVDSILENEANRNAFMKSFEEDDSTSYNNLMELLEHVRSLDKSDRDRLAKATNTEPLNSEKNLDGTKKTDPANVEKYNSNNTSEKKDAESLSKSEKISKPITPVDSPCFSGTCVLV